MKNLPLFCAFASVTLAQLPAAAQSAPVANPAALAAVRAAPFPGFATTHALKLAFDCGRQADFAKVKCAGRPAEWQAVADNPALQRWYTAAGDADVIPQFEHVMALPATKGATVLLGRQLIETDNGNSYSFAIITLFGGHIAYRVLACEVRITSGYLITGRDDKEGTTLVSYTLGANGSINRFKAP